MFDYSRHRDVRQETGRWAANSALRCIALLAALIQFGCAATHESPPVAHLPPSLAAFGQLPTLEQVALSPDGSRIAFLKRIGDTERVVALVSMSDQQLLATVRMGDAKVRGIKWVDEDQVLITTSTTAVAKGLSGGRSEWYMLQVYDLAEHQVRPLLTGSANHTMNVALGRSMVRRIGGRTVLFVPGAYSTDQWVLPGLFRIDVKSGKEELIKKGSATAQCWLVTDMGEVVAEHDYDGERWAIRIGQDGALHEVAAGTDPFGEFEIIGFDSSGAALITQQDDGEKFVLKPLSLTDGGWGPETEIGWEDDLILHRLTDRVIGRFRIDDQVQYAFADAALQARWDQGVRAFQGEHVALASMSDDGARFAILVDGPTHEPTYELVDTTEHRVTSIGAAYDGLPPLATVRRISYPAADGLEIPAYLTLPNGRQPHGLPLIVLPHGGPAARDTMGFDWWAQALAARGYAVLQPNFRGSTVNPRHLSAGFGEFGRKMQTDVSDGVRYLVQQNIVDPKRVCVVGASYGGYVALAGVTLESDVYRCAVSVAGISGLQRWLKWEKDNEDRRPGPAQRYWDRFLGTKGANDPRLAAISPIEHATSVSVPVLLIHGRDDTVVPYEQSTRMASALERAGKPVEMVTLDREDHLLSRSATRLQMLEHVVAFLDVNNPPD